MTTGSQNDGWDHRFARIIGGVVITLIVAVIVGWKVFSAQVAAVKSGELTDVCLGVFGCNGLQAHELVMMAFLIVSPIIIGLLVSLIDGPRFTGGVEDAEE